MTGAQAIRDYEPGVIFKKLGKLHEHFYPQPMVSSNVRGHISLTATPDVEHLTKEQLPKLWWKCGSALHRSPMAKVLTDDSRFSGDCTEIIDWHNKVIGLLESHWISSASGKGAIFVLLKDATNGGRASATNLTFSPEQRRVALQTMTIVLPQPPEDEGLSDSSILVGHALRPPREK